MTFAGKKLQDIYDSGSARLSELEDLSQSKLQAKSASHLTERQESEQQSKMEVAAKAAYVEEEIKKHSRETCERIKAAVEKEKQTSAQYLAQLTAKLSSFNTELKATIEDLKTSYQAGLEDNYQRASDHYAGAVEGTAQEIEGQHYQSGQRLRSQSSFFANSLQQKLDHSLWESRGSEKQSNSQLFRNYMQKANAIESHFSTLMQRLNGEFQSEFHRLEAYAKDTEQSISDATDSISHHIDSVLTEIEREVNEIFAAASQSNKEGIKERSSGNSEKVETHGKDTAKQLRDEVSELASRLADNSVLSNDALKGRCDEVRDKSHAEMKAFIARMTENVNESEETRKQLAEAKSRVIGEIRSDLIDIKDGFEKNLKEMMKEAMTDLESVQNEVVDDMSSAFERSLQKINSDSQSARGEIEEAVNRLLAMISQQKEQALKEIAKAAGE